MASEVPLWIEYATGVLLVAGALFALLGSIGLLRLGTFYERLHAPTIGASFGTGCILLASIVYFTMAQSRPVMHELLIALFIFVTTPITLMVLVRAALFRDRLENADNVPPLDAPSDMAPR